MRWEPILRVAFYASEAGREPVRDRVARTLFTVEGDTMVILHAFVKKGAKAPDVELDVARRRLTKLKGHPR